MDKPKRQAGASDSRSVHSGADRTTKAEITQEMVEAGAAIIDDAALDGEYGRGSLDVARDVYIAMRRLGSVAPRRVPKAASTFHPERYLGNGDAH